MIDYALLLDRLRLFSTTHEIIKSFTTGPEKNMDRLKFNEYPLMHVVYNGASYSDNTKTYDLEVIFLELPMEHATQQEQERMVSNMEHAAEDLISEIAVGTLFSMQTDLVDANTGIAIQTANTTSIVESKSNAMCGVSLTLGLQVPAPYNACKIPFI